MAKPYRLIVFDWEGTLGDGIAPVLATMAREAKRLNLGHFDEIKVRQLMVHGLNKAIKMTFLNISPAQYHELMEALQKT